MGSGGKGQDQEVYDFLMSIDYGFVHGPVDHLNKVWVKDKPILCDHYWERKDVEIVLPNLFGGDEAEGGVVGTLEFYPGDFEQESSVELSARPGMNPTTMPGYRGLSHLFFRGLRESASEQADFERIEEEEQVILNPVVKIVASLTEGLRRTTARVGWKWGTNNPYLPKVKASYTRLPTPSPYNALKAIWPVIGVDANGDFISAEPPKEQWVPNGADALTGEFPIRSTIDNQISTLVHIGGGALDPSITDEDIDSGEVPILVSAGWSGYEYANIQGQDNYVGPNAHMEIVFHSAEPVDHWAQHEIRPQDPINPRTDIQTGLRGSWEVNAGPLYVPPGTRYVQFRGGVTGSIYYRVVVTGKQYTIGIPKYVPVHCEVGDELGPLPNANPAYIIMEAMINEDWGKADSISMLDMDSINAAAQTLYDEHFGLSMAWFAQDEIDVFIGEVLDHIQAFFYQDPSTGLWTLKLLRDDYDVETLETLDETNCVATDRKRRHWGETINEIVVSYTDPTSEKSATVSSHHLANIQIQGGVSSETRDYHGIRDPYLAKFVADRDVAAAGYPLFSCQAVVDRREWDARPGDVRKFSWAEDGIEEIVVRVMDVDYGKPGDREITLSLTEDIFAVDRAAYAPPETSGWAPANQLPTPLEAQLTVTPPLPALVRNGQTVEDIDANYPNIVVGLMADDDVSRPTSIDVYTETVDRTGASSVNKVGSIDVTRSGLLETALVAEAQSVIAREVIDTITRVGADPGDFLMLGSSEAESELVMLDTLDEEAGTWTVARGMWDTVPLAWPVGSRLWMFDSDGGGNLDPVGRSAGETMDYKLLPRTNQGTLSYDSAPWLYGAATDRPFAPFRPGDTQIEASGFAEFSQRAPQPPATMTVTWATRNRTSEDQVAVRWTEADAAAEEGQTTVLRVYNDLGAFEREIVGLTGSSYAIPSADLPAARKGHIEFLSERDGIRSLYIPRRDFDVRPVTGWGEGYGFGYGGE